MKKSRFQNHLNVIKEAKRIKDGSDDVCEECGLPEKVHPLMNMVNINTGKRWSCKQFKPRKGQGK